MARGPARLRGSARILKIPEITACASGQYMIESCEKYYGNNGLENVKIKFYTSGYP